MDQNFLKRSFISLKKLTLYFGLLGQEIRMCCCRENRNRAIFNYVYFVIDLQKDWRC